MVKRTLLGTPISIDEEMIGRHFLNICQDQQCNGKCEDKDGDYICTRCGKPQTSGDEIIKKACQIEDDAPS